MGAQVVAAGCDTGPCKLGGGVAATASNLCGLRRRGCPRGFEQLICQITNSFGETGEVRR